MLGFDKLFKENKGIESDKSCKIAVVGQGRPTFVGQGHEWAEVLSYLSI